MGKAAERDFFIIPLVRVIQVGEGSGWVRGGIIGVADGGGREVGDFEEAVVVIAEGTQAKRTFCGILPGIELDIEPVGVGSRSCDRVPDSQVGSDDGNLHVTGVHIFDNWPDPN